MEDKKNISLSLQLNEIFVDLNNKLGMILQYTEVSDVANIVSKLELESQKEDLWQDPEKATALLQDLNKQKKFLDQVVKVDKDIKSLYSFFTSVEADDEMYEEILGEVNDLLQEVDKLYIPTLFKDKHDDMGCFVTVTAGSGGSEAEDWASMLFGMYWSFGKRSDSYKVEVIEYSETDDGLKTGCLKFTGSPLTFPYGRLKGEHGVHRLVRPSPFNANNNRHTSFASVLVMPVMDDSVSVTINENDLRIDTYRSSGAGGQHVNKTDSAVRITHLPTGIVVQCQNDRSQHRNKAEAMSMLKSRLYVLAEEQKKKEVDVEKASISWGNQIRSYVLDSSRVKDLRTGFQSSQPDKVLGGDIDEFLEAYIKWNMCLVPFKSPSQ